MKTRHPGSRNLRQNRPKPMGVEAGKFKSLPQTQASGSSRQPIIKLFKSIKTAIHQAVHSLKRSRSR